MSKYKIHIRYSLGRAVITIMRNLDSCVEEIIQHGSISPNNDPTMLSDAAFESINDVINKYKCATLTANSIELLDIVLDRRTNE